MGVLRVACANANCRTRLRIQPSQAGRRMRCPVCGLWFIAPRIAEAAGAASYVTDGADDDVDRPIPLWKTALFVLFLLIGFFLLLGLIAAFEIWQLREQE